MYDITKMDIKYIKKVHEIEDIPIYTLTINWVCEKVLDRISLVDGKSS